ncbi:MAG: hypothetical protein JRN52_04805 [Nitrososphaerota archaeon]|nr:hypothetical protein [Nitrososphaerota archaeon]
MECHFCGRGVEGLPFRCNYCGNSFCGEHRLPENHSCPRVGGPIQPGYAKISAPRSKPKISPFGVPVARSTRRRFGLKYRGLLSKVEQKHVLMATLVMVLVGISLNPGLIFAQPWILLVLTPGFVLSFLGHELAHKLLAQRNGLWAEFRTTMYGLLLTAASAVLPIKFLAPGQVNIQGDARKDVMGAIGLIGPGLNIVLAAGFIVAYRISHLLIGLAMIQLGQFNAWLAIINLIPFGSLDGTRVFNWDKARWGIAMAASVVVLILSSYPQLV